MILFYLWVVSAWAQVSLEAPLSPSRSRGFFEITFEHTNDADLLGGNDKGYTFGSRIRGNVFEELPDQSRREIQFQIGNDFYTGTRKQFDAQGNAIGEIGQTDRDEEGNLYINFIEEFRLGLGVRQNFDEEKMKLDEGGESWWRPYWLLAAAVTYETSDQSWSGSGTQSAVHDWAGITPSPMSSRSYNYSKNQIDMSRFGVEMTCHRGVDIELGKTITCEAGGGLTLKTVALDDGSFDFGAKVAFHTAEEDWLARKRPVVSLFGTARCKQYFDFENRDTEVSAGVELNIPWGERKRFRCVIEFVEPLENNETLHKGLNDGDHLVDLMLGISW